MFIDTVEESAATGPVAEYYQQQRAAWGFLPNYAPAFSPRPDVGQAWNLLNTTIRAGMDRRRFELATIAAARAQPLLAKFTFPEFAQSGREVHYRWDHL